MAKVIEEPFHLTDADGNVTAADGTATTWSDIWKYQVPLGVTHILRSEHTFSAYIKDTGGSEGAAPDCQIKVEVRDPSEQDKRPVFGPAMYNRVTEFQDRDKMAYLKVPSEGIVVKPRDWIVVMTYDDTATDASESYFDLYITRIRETVV